MRRYVLPAAIALVSLLAASAACGESGPEPTATATLAATARPEPALFPYHVTDSNGNTVTFEAPPERIVAIDSAVVEILFAIGQGHRVVGTHKFVSYPPQTKDIPRVSDASNIDIEATVALEPDLVLIFSDGFLPDLERAGLKVLYVKSLSDDFRKVADNIRMWGKITGSPDAAQATAARFEARIRDIERKLEGRESGPTVFQDQGTLWTPGPDTLMGQVFSLLKLENIASDVSGYAQLSPEVIVVRDPEIVIASFSDEISGNPAFKDLSAVRNGRVLVLSSDALSVAGPRFVDGIEEIARWVYPELFE